jgi:hypothetical protein
MRVSAPVTRSKPSDNPARKHYKARARPASGLPDPASPCEHVGQSPTIQTKDVASSAHHACLAATFVANTMIISAALAISRVYQCVRGRSPTWGDRPRMPSGIGASDAHVRRRLGRRGAQCRQLHRSTRANTSAAFKITRRDGGIRGAGRIHRPNGECVKTVSIEGAD